MLKLLSAAPRETLTLLSCSPNFPRAFITRYTHAKHELILNFFDANIDKLNVWRTRKKSEPQMGFEPMTLRDLVGCSNH